MSQLGKLLAMQKAKVASVGTGGGNPIERVEEPAKPVEPVEPAKVAEPAKPANPLGGLKLLNTATAAAKPVPAKLADDFSLEDLASLDVSSVEESRQDQTTISGFFDEIEATAPDRQLDPELDSQQRMFVEQLDGIYPVLHDTDLFAQSVRVIMMELQENPEYIKLVADQDVHTMIRGMRNSMGMARIKKQEKSRKGGAGRAAAKTKKSSASSEDLALLDSVFGDLD